MIQANNEETFLIIDLNTVQDKDSFPFSCLITPLHKVGGVKSKYITDCLVCFSAPKEQAEAIHKILTGKKIKVTLQSRIKEDKLFPL